MPPAATPLEALDELFTHTYASVFAALDMATLLADEDRLRGLLKPFARELKP